MAGGSGFPPPEVDRPGQSLNLYMAGASGKKLDELYKHAWLRGLKTTYYLRTLAATSAEKSTGRGGELNAVSSQAQTAPAAAVDNTRPLTPSSAASTTPIARAASKAHFVGWNTPQGRSAEWAKPLARLSQTGRRKPLHPQAAWPPGGFGMQARPRAQGGGLEKCRARPRNETKAPQ
ncbi:ribonucleotide-diphosphate reductase subunit alpha [Chromobacterium violaceum]|uniref:Ribonucleotide-diphosphate reductase subunit alpha n=1 Tax=Chromobacterium violaceum TaxID=536 RepID=A0A3S4IG87_CHRVL|nr:ribonucleotide-diphosphate reductase subunit alpha [Chromobacterium violaceum]